LVVNFFDCGLQIDFLLYAMSILDDEIHL